MGQVLPVILFLVPAFAAVIFVWVIGDAGFEQLVKRLTARLHRPAEVCNAPIVVTVPDMRRLNCRVHLAKEEHKGGCFEVFKVEICGSMHAAENVEHVGLRIGIEDVTEYPTILPLHSRLKQWRKHDSPAFLYAADLGKMLDRNRTIDRWMCVARIHADWLTLPRRGQRKLWFAVSMISRETGGEIAGAACAFIYDNPEFGYLDFQENIKRAKTLAVALAFAVSAVEEPMYDCEIELIKEWARGNIDFAQSSDAARRSFEKALDKTVAFFRSGSLVDTCKICQEIVQITPVGARYEIVELCLRVAQASGSVSPAETDLLKHYADYLQVDQNRFRAMMQKILPVDIHEAEDVEAILGVTSDMDREQARQRLNAEYRKWNARVTSSDPEIQAQADHMLSFIAQARKEYVAS